MVNVAPFEAGGAPQQATTKMTPPPINTTTPKIDDADDSNDGDSNNQKHVRVDIGGGNDDEDEVLEKRTPWYGGNITPWWFLCTIYMLVFVVYMGFRSFGYASVAFIIHTIIAFIFITSCAWNLLHTPSQGKSYRHIHIIMGRIAMMCGFFVVVTGYVLVLTGDSSLSNAAEITFMATGGMQILLQGCLIFAIRVPKSTYHMNI
ncbi:MAG: hypothetical protein SGBAC_002287 [Bacillariaceae sp.]